MAKTQREKSLTISRETYDDATTTPHFPIEISYFGHHVSFDDVYLDDPQQFIRQLQALEDSRTGEVCFDGGHRIKILFKGDPHGGVLISFRSEQHEPGFPGKWPRASANRSASADTNR